MALSYIPLEYIEDDVFHLIRLLQTPYIIFSYIFPYNLTFLKVSDVNTCHIVSSCTFTSIYHLYRYSFSYLW